MSSKSSPLIVERVCIAGVEVDALIDTGATMSCCGWGWFKRNQSRLGPLEKMDTYITGISNSPIGVKGVTRDLVLRWGTVEGTCRLVA